MGYERPPEKRRVRGHADRSEPLGELQLPLPTPHFKQRAWVQFQRALDPLSPPKPMRRPQPR